MKEDKKAHGTPCGNLKCGKIKHVENPKLILTHIPVDFLKIGISRVFCIMNEVLFYICEPDPINHEKVESRLKLLGFQCLDEFLFIGFNEAERILKSKLSECIEIRMSAIFEMREDCNPAIGGSTTIN